MSYPNIIPITSSVSTCDYPALTSAISDLNSAVASIDGQTIDPSFLMIEGKTTVVRCDPEYRIEPQGEAEVTITCQTGEVTFLAFFSVFK